MRTLLWNRRSLIAFLFVLVLVAGSGEAAARSSSRTVSRVSVSSAGKQSTGSPSVTRQSISANGRYVTFDSKASDLVVGDTNGFLNDVFVRDRRTGVTERVSVGPGGRQSNSYSFGSVIAPSGRFVAFETNATNLVAGDAESNGDVVLRDRLTRTTEWVSQGLAGTQSEPFSDSREPSLSASGRFVAFTSTASNLVPGDTNEVGDVFVRDRARGTTERVSVGGARAQANGVSGGGPQMSASGRFVVFASLASNLVPSDTNESADVFIRDRFDGVTRRVSVGLYGAQANGRSVIPAISANGRFVAFESTASNLVSGDTNNSADVFVRDMWTGGTERVSVDGHHEANNGSFVPAMSADGRVITFVSSASNLVPGDTNASDDVFVRDLRTRTTHRLSVGPTGRQADTNSLDASISADGRHVAFSSLATNLVPNDTNDAIDVFVSDQRSDEDGDEPADSESRLP